MSAGNNYCEKHGLYICKCKEKAMEKDVKWGDDKILQKGYITKDSGKRQEFESGMRRDITDGKIRYDLIWRPGLKRLAELMYRGAIKYGDNNWQKAMTQQELDRFKESANRHFEQWFQGETDEDHMSAVVFNLFGAEFVKQRLGK